MADAQTDVVYFANGVRLTGEVKSLDRGKMSFDAPATGVIQIEWDKVERLESSTSYEVMLVDGRRLYGSLAGVDDAAQIRL